MRSRFNYVALVILLSALLFAPQIACSAETSGNSPTPTDTPKTSQEEKLDKEFWNFWGAGFILNFDMGHRKPVKSAMVINGITRVDEEEDVKYGLGLEIHKFIWGKAHQRKTSATWWAWALGPYFSILPGNNNIIDSIGAGFVFGFTRGLTIQKNGSTVPDKNKLSMNIGIGGYVDPGTQVLADGFEDGAAPPNGETSVRFKKVTQYGFQGVLSFTYDF